MKGDTYNLEAAVATGLFPESKKFHKGLLGQESNW